MGETMIKANGVAICTESFGDPANPAVLLIMGATASMLWWPEDLCRRLADLGRYVIRYDNRDTGRSVTYAPGPPPYTIDDMADDALGVLGAYGLERAHLVGMSLGGMIAQLVALKHPQIVLTTTLISSSLFDRSESGLSPMDERIVAHHAGGATLQWSGEAAVTDFMVEGWRLLSGSAHPFDEASIRTIAIGELKRANNLLSMLNHALLTGGEDWHGRLHEITSPTLIIHGTEDPILPFDHGVALSKAIPGAKLLALNGTGHELHEADWNTIISAVVQHTTTVF